MEYLKIEVSNDCYRPDAVRKTMTVSELIAELKRYDGSQQVVISNADNDMFCGIWSDCIEKESFKD